jgi:hypothetical protein
MLTVDLGFLYQDRAVAESDFIDTAITVQEILYRDCRFILTKKTEQANGQEMELCLDEPLAGTSHRREYKSVKYMMR